ncbi:MAG: aminotransferase class IV [Clostridium sp.]|nr:aminotransferase class IV [Clostridium sp.]
MRKIIFNDDKALIDTGIFFGRGVFETILLKGKPHFLNEHVERLNDGITKLSLGDHITSDMVLEKINEYKLDNLALKIVVTEKNIIFSTREIKYKAENYEQGFKVKLSNNIRNSKSCLTYIKSINYLDNLLEYEKAQKEEYNEVLFLNENNKLSEGSTTNVFIVKDNKIYTPSEKCGLLSGIIRKYVIDNFKVYEKEISKEELLNADEVFLTNSLVGVIKVSEIEGCKFRNRVAEKVRKAYEEYIGVREEN